MKTIEENRIRDAAMECGNAQGWDISPFVANGFFRGARWMERTLLQDLWHDANETPDSQSTILAVYEETDENGKTHTVCNVLSEYYSFELYRKKVPVLQWAYLSDLLPRKGGEQ